MDGRIPSDYADIRRRLIQSWIAKRHDAQQQIDGCETLAKAIWKVLTSMMASAGIRAVFSRAIKRAGQDHSQLACLVVTEDGIDFSRLRAALGNENPTNLREVLVALIDEVFYVLNDLLGPTLTPIVREVEIKLERKASDLREGEAQVKTKGAVEGSTLPTDEEKR